jgi:hypothetical protein
LTKREAPNSGGHVYASADCPKLDRRRTPQAARGGVARPREKRSSFQPGATAED